MNDHQQAATHLLDAATDNLRPDVDRIVAGSVVRGRALRRRARVGTTLAAAAVVGVTGLAASLLPAGGGGSGRERDEEPPPPSRRQTGARWRAPSPRCSRAAAPRPSPTSGAAATTGAACSIGAPRSTSTSTGPPRATRRQRSPTPAATTWTRAGPGPARSRGTETSSGPGDLSRKKSEADLTRPDGWRVSVVATNDREAGGPVVTRDPALSWAQLLRIARPTSGSPTADSLPFALDEHAATGGSSDHAARGHGEQVPSTVERLLGRQDAGPLRTEPAYGAVSEPRRVIAHFSWRGAATRRVERSRMTRSPACDRSVGPGYTCTSDAAGHPMLLWGPTTGDGVAAQGATVWRDGFEVGVLSYNAAEGKARAGRSTAAAHADDLSLLAASDAWFVLSYSTACSATHSTSGRRARQSVRTRSSSSAAWIEGSKP